MIGVEFVDSMKLTAGYLVATHCASRSFGIQGCVPDLPSLRMPTKNSFPDGSSNNASEVSSSLFTVSVVPKLPLWNGTYGGMQLPPCFSDSYQRQPCGWSSREIERYGPLEGASPITLCSAGGTSPLPHLRLTIVVNTGAQTRV